MILTVILAVAQGLADVSSESELEDYIRANTGTIHHAVGTARMSGWGSGNGVLNPDLTVVGTHGLRVVDACIFVCTSLNCEFEYLLSLRHSPFDSLFR